mmetsp:Transcript_8539/g.31776  ORF Transcript_8539/g.31776 Transcript_8539/m.31776 type:complete len:307 (-) Transcript_8539:373-1293(-)
MMNASLVTSCDIEASYTSAPPRPYTSKPCKNTPGVSFPTIPLEPDNPAVAAARIAAGRALPVATTTSTPDANARRSASAVRGVITLLPFNNVPSKSTTNTLRWIDTSTPSASPDARRVKPVTFQPSALKTSCSAAAITSASASLSSWSSPNKCSVPCTSNTRHSSRNECPTSSACLDAVSTLTTTSPSTAMGPKLSAGKLSTSVALSFDRNPAFKLRIYSSEHNATLSSRCDIDLGNAARIRFIPGVDDAERSNRIMARASSSTSRRSARTSTPPPPRDGDALLTSSASSSSSITMTSHTHSTSPT